jgi:hypothetical protein
MSYLIIKEHIKNIDDLPKIEFTYSNNKYEDSNILLFENILNTITDINKKYLIIELLNYDNIKDYILFCNNNLYFSNINFINHIITSQKYCETFNNNEYIIIDTSKIIDPFISGNTTYLDTLYLKNKKFEYTILYNNNINILHLILFHDLNINRVLIFLLYIYYTFDINNRKNYKQNYKNLYNVCKKDILINIIKYYCNNVVSTFNFNKPYIYDYSFEYEKIFLENKIFLISNIEINNEITKLKNNNDILINKIKELEYNNKILFNDIIKIKENTDTLTNKFKLFIRNLFN